MITSYVTYEKGPWLKELGELGITLNDGEGPIEILLGADLAGCLLTGRTHKLSCGLVAVDTRLGWTVMGRVPPTYTCHSNLASVITVMHLTGCSLENLWKLDIMGISDPAEQKTRDQIHQETLNHFLNTVTVNSENRYEVHLPWQENRDMLPTNRQLAEARLLSATKKLKAKNLYEEYNQVLMEWQSEGIIEEVVDISCTGHYLPHRPVIKESSATTKIRPVFDASAKESGSISLNDCLNEGPNLIEKIPAVLLRFREKKFGVSADIRKAFLQISVQPEDRDYLRFLWWDETGENIKVYRHMRVVFGVKSSPFLLGAVINYHLQRCATQADAEKSLIHQLNQSFYVDNVATSVNTAQELNNFIREARTIMSSGGFDLRCWIYSGYKESEDPKFNILGLDWNCQEDVLSINLKWLKDVNTQRITKKNILSVVQRVFDPIGFVCPVMLCPKLLLQRTWEKKIGWDTELEAELKKTFLEWLHGISLFDELRIPRWIGGTDNKSIQSIHTFCDASKEAYAAAVFLRTENADGVSVQLIQAKSRVAPLKKLTMPRLELLGAIIGARLTRSVIEALSWGDIHVHMWTDSSVVLAWIYGDDQWSIFVKNRVTEIKELTGASCWRHVPGTFNPADLPSRGCTPQRLIASKWWEGPAWLKEPPENWPHSKVEFDETSVFAEKKKTQVSLISRMEDCGWYLIRFSHFEQIVRLIAWISRFIHNARCRDIERRKRIIGELTVELYSAENILFKTIQNESFKGLDDERLSMLNPFYENGIIKIKTKLLLREDMKDFRCPVVLPAHNLAVERLIFDEHVKRCHAGVQLLLNFLRERFWILGGRKTIKRVISKCVKCRRFQGSSLQSDPAPLPADRVKEASVFEVVGIDLAGPLYLKGGEKAWLCLFTCAVFRAVHIELISSLSTESFLQAFRRFVARRGRPSTVYSDNGTNFVGADNLFAKVDWGQIERYSSAQRIDWKFNPPSAAWWGGWWERLIGLVKQLLRRILGKACLTYQEMTTVLCDCEAVINSRPLTYVSADASDLVPLTPSFFLQEVREIGVPDCDHVENVSLNRRMGYLQRLRDDLRKRFRQEYLGQLVHRKKATKNTQALKAGDVVILGNDNTKRLNWPLARIVELIPGSDSRIRLVRLKTMSGELLRPIQRIYPLEISDEDKRRQQVLNTKLESSSQRYNKQESLAASTQVRTRSGRLVIQPVRYIDVE